MPADGQRQQRAAAAAEAHVHPSNPCSPTRCAPCSEKHVLEECPEIIQLTLETAPPAAQPAASDADLELALDALDDFLGQPGGGFDLLDGGLGLPDLSSLPSYPGAAGQQQQQQQGPGEASDVASGSAAQPAAARVLERARALDAAQRSVAVAADLALRLFQQEVRCCACPGAAVWAGRAPDE